MPAALLLAAGVICFAVGAFEPSGVLCTCGFTLLTPELAAKSPS
ncbi:hypothetical protein ACIBLA_08810 [Streptomyces sp. NPDC050433]